MAQGRFPPPLVTYGLLILSLSVDAALALSHRKCESLKKQTPASWKILVIGCPSHKAEMLSMVETGLENRETEPPLHTNGSELWNSLT